MDETPRDEQAVAEVDPSLVVAAALAELELLRAETSITISQLEAIRAVDPPLSDLSPLGRRQL
ncbi:MAG TPA: hypothetical protein VFA44_00010 [Gaiellaceae bacterium]|nr:hypothetical protein [Gaiellaceae bacterium]